MAKTLELSKELITKSSITPEDKGCQDLMIDHLKPLGFDVEILNFDMFVLLNPLGTACP